MRRELELLGADVVLCSDSELGLVVEGFDPQAEHAAEILTGDNHSLLPIFLMVVQRLFREGRVELSHIEKMVGSPKFPLNASKEAPKAWDGLAPAKLVLKVHYQYDGWRVAARCPLIPLELQQEALLSGKSALRELAENRYLDPFILGDLAKRFPVAWLELARNPSTPPEALILIAQKGEGYTLRTIAVRPAAATEALLLIATRGYALALEDLSRRGDLEEQVILELARRDHFGASTKLLRHRRQLSEAALEELSRSQHTAVQSAAQRELYRRQQMRLAL